MGGIKRADILIIPFCFVERYATPRRWRRRNGRSWKPDRHSRPTMGQTDCLGFRRTRRDSIHEWNFVCRAPLPAGTGPRAPLEGAAGCPLENRNKKTWKIPWQKKGTGHVKFQFYVMKSTNFELINNIVLFKMWYFEKEYLKTNS